MFGTIGFNRNDMNICLQFPVKKKVKIEICERPYLRMNEIGVIWADVPASQTNKVKIDVLRTSNLRMIGGWQPANDRTRLALVFHQWMFGVWYLGFVVDCISHQDCDWLIHSERSRNRGWKSGLAILIPTTVIIKIGFRSYYSLLGWSEFGMFGFED